MGCELSSGILLPASQLVCSDWINLEWNAVLSDRSLLVLRQSLSSTKDFATSHLIAALDWLLRVTELAFSPSEWSWAKPIILFILPNRERVSKIQTLLGQMTPDWPEHMIKAMPLLFTTPYKLATLLSQKQINAQNVEKIFIDDLSNFAVSTVSKDIF